MHTDRLIVVGAGGHARVVMDALLIAPGSGVRGALLFADDDASLHGALMLGRLVAGSVDEVVLSDDRVHVAVGANAMRRTIAGRVTARGARLAVVVHPLASVSPFATLADGVFIAASAVVGPMARIGVGVIVNHGAVVDHDCHVGEFAHIAPNATLGGRVQVGIGALVGAGANVLPGLHIGSGAVVGAGAVVVADVPDNAVQAGVPAKNIEGIRT